MKHLLLFYLVLLSGQSMAQNNYLQANVTIPVRANYFSTDPVGNIYVVKDDNFIVKFNAQGDSLGVYNNIRNGSVSQIDASNPLRVLVFYGQYGIINILDNMLSLKNEIDLKRIGLFNVPCIANSADANIWVYDPAGNLLKIDERLNSRFSMPLRNMMDDAISPVQMMESNRELYLSDTSLGVFKFDRFGFYQSRYPFLSPEVQVLNNHLVYRKDSTLVSYNMKSFSEQKIMLPLDQEIIQVRYERNLLFVLRKGELTIFSTEE